METKAFYDISAIAGMKNVVWIIYNIWLLFWLVIGCEECSHLSSMLVVMIAIRALMKVVIIFKFIKYQSKREEVPSETTC